jgi:hypothetical protein
MTVDEIIGLVNLTGDLSAVGRTFLRSVSADHIGPPKRNR